ncbi:hypothetical protein ACFV4P_09365 [Kitasatospora sp. NPDC059795]|uniref:hypothetical protein n=1 Tax=Kitasatospora sp. NPDC059795 TaxID=3346949 RepID=UPI0036501873
MNVVIQAGARPPAKAATMSFLSASHRRLAVMPPAETPEATTLRAVDAVLVAPVDRTEAERSRPGARPVHAALPGRARRTPQSLGDLSEVQRHLVRFAVDRDDAARLAGARDALRRWQLPTGPTGLRTYVGSV